MDRFFVKDNDGEKGPFTFEELTDGRLEPDDMVRTPFSNWTKASDILDFAEYFRYEGYYFPTESNLAGFGYRLLAFIVDYFVISMILRLEFSLLRGYLPVEKLNNISLSHPINPSDVKDVLILQGVFFVTVWLYNLICLVTPLSATLGQVLFKLIVVDQEGLKMSFGRALLRSFVKMISIIFCFVGFLLALFGDYNQAVHDRVAKTYVLRKDVL
jgi:uncharacterized RDD family membrane protein YckC